VNRVLSPCRIFQIPGYHMTFSIKTFVKCYLCNRVLNRMTQQLSYSSNKLYFHSPVTWYHIQGSSTCRTTTETKQESLELYKIPIINYQKFSNKFYNKSKLHHYNIYFYPNIFHNDPTYLSITKSLNCNTSVQTTVTSKYALLQTAVSSKPVISYR
jgi:hypothetical protein